MSVLIDLYPTKCNLCGGDVYYISNSKIYGREYGSGKCYYCTNCGAYVGTHKPRPKEALGILGNAKMREMKMKCHELFDRQWKKEKTQAKRQTTRKKAYADLAVKLNISVDECHFGYFDMDMLNKAYGILKGGGWN